MNLEERRRLNPEGFARQDRAKVLERDISSLAAHIHAASYRLIEMLAEFESLHGWEGWPSPAHWLQWRCNFSLNAAREKFRVARALPALPLIAQAFEKGSLSFAQVRAMTRIARPDNQKKVLMWAKHSTASQLEKLARLYRRHGENADALDQHRERSFGYWEEDHGMMNFRIRLPAEQAAVVLQAIEAARSTLDGQDRDGVAAAPATEDVTAETRRGRTADAFVRVMESYLEPDTRPRATAEKYQVHVHLDLRKEADGPVEDPDAPALAEETVRRLGCEAGLVAVVHDGEEILSVGRKTRAVPPAIRHWADGGETKLSNLVELCGWHHRLLHEGGYGLKRIDDGALVFTRPNGERIVPRPLVPEGEIETHVTAETCACHWDGQRPDYSTMVEMLDKPDQAW